MASYKYLHDWTSLFNPNLHANHDLGRLKTVFQTASFLSFVMT